MSKYKAYFKRICRALDKKKIVYQYTFSGKKIWEIYTLNDWIWYSNGVIEYFKNNKWYPTTINALLASIKLYDS